MKHTDYSDAIKIKPIPEFRKDREAGYINVISGDTLVCKIPYYTEENGSIGDLSENTAEELASRIRNIFEFTFKNDPNYV